MLCYSLKNSEIIAQRRPMYLFADTSHNNAKDNGGSTGYTERFHRLHGGTYDINQSD